IEPRAAIGVIRHVGQDVVATDLDPLVGDVLRMHEHDLVDRLLHRDDDRAREAVEIPTRDESHPILRNVCFYHQKRRASNAATAVSTRNTRGPRETGANPTRCRDASSASMKPPSGPMASVT